MTSLEDILPELVISIIEQLADDLTTLRSLCLVSSTIRFWSEPVLYREIFVRTGEQCFRLLNSVKNYPPRATGVQVIDARCQKDTVSVVDALSEIITRSHNLKTLTLESPLCNWGYWTENEEWNGLDPCMTKAVVQTGALLEHQISESMSYRLKTLTLHLSGRASRYWAVENDLGIIFAHRTLEEVTISCANVHAGVLARFNGVNSTPLRSLTMIECNVSLRGLREVLNKPRSLKSLYLGENNDHMEYRTEESNPQMLVRMGSAFFEALRLQKESLESLTYVSHHHAYNASTPRIIVPGDCFAGFHRLTALSIESDSSEVLTILSDPMTRPPCLEKFRFRIDFDGILSWDVADDTDASSEAEVDDSFRRLEDWCSSLSHIPTLQCLEAVFPRYPLTGENVERFKRISQKFDTAKTKVLITSEERVFGYIPPFLFEEQPPRYAVTFDSSIQTAMKGINT